MATLEEDDDEVRVRVSISVRFSVRVLGLVLGLGLLRLSKRMMRRLGFRLRLANNHFLILTLTL
jgi:hypothetical protein